MASKKKKKSVNLDDNIWSRLTNKQKHIVCILFLLAAPLFLYHATVFGGYQYMGNDDIQWRAGAESLKEYEEEFNDVSALGIEHVFGYACYNHFTSAPGCKS